MGPLGPPHDDYAREEEEERKRQDAVAKALALFESNPEFASVRVQIHDKDQEIERIITEGAKERLTEARLEHLLKFLDNRGEAYLRLVTDLESEKAFTAIMDDFVRETWWNFSFVPIETIPPTFPFDKPLPTQAQRDRIRERARYWVMEGYRQLASGSQPRTTSTGPRRGYRSHIRAWMKREGLESVNEAAKRLAVSESTLKSIMSNKGDARYGAETLEQVLKKTGYPSGE